MYKNKDIIISEHAPKSKRPLTDRQFANFLAGLIDGGGQISKKGDLFILFHEKDISVAYYIKKSLNHGNIKKVKGYRAYNFRCTCLSLFEDEERLKKIRKLLLDKLKQSQRIKQLNCHLTPKITFNLCPDFASGKGKGKKSLLDNNPLNQGSSQLKESTLSLSANCLLKNHWLAGFIQANGSFVIKTLKRLNKIENQIVIQVNQEDDFLLKQIQQTLNGYIGSRESCKSYYYSSLSLSNTIKAINYLDSYQVMGATLTAYWLWRKAYLILQDNKHNEHAGIYKFIRLKKSLTVLNG